MAERIRISLSGRIGVEVGDEVVDGAALGPLGGPALAFLVTERRRPVSRDELAEVLWGEALPPSWEASLRAVVSRVRRRLVAAGMVGDVITGSEMVDRLRHRKGHPSLGNEPGRASTCHVR